MGRLGNERTQAHYLSPDWEFNFGVGVGVTHGTDHLLVKMIVGRRFKLGG